MCNHQFIRIIERKLTKPNEWLILRSYYQCKLCKEVRIIQDIPLEQLYRTTAFIEVK